MGSEEKSKGVTINDLDVDVVRRILDFVVMCYSEYMYFGLSSVCKSFRIASHEVRNLLMTRFRPWVYS
jgi:F-box domain